MYEYVDIGMRELAVQEIDEVNGGLGPVAVAILVAGGYYIYWTIKTYDM